MDYHYLLHNLRWLDIRSLKLLNIVIVPIYIYLNHLYHILMCTQIDVFVSMFVSVCVCLYNNTFTVARLLYTCKVLYIPSSRLTTFALGWTAFCTNYWHAFVGSGRSAQYGVVLIGLFLYPQYQVLGRIGKDTSACGHF